jgi:hypothetical protein
MIQQLSRGDTPHRLGRLNMARKFNYLRPLHDLLSRYRHEFTEEGLTFFGDTGWSCSFTSKELTRFGKRYEGLQRIVPKEFQITEDD